MTFTAITGSGDVTMGTPGSITDTSTNAVTTNSHTHAVSHTGTGNFAMAVSPTFTGTVTLPQTNMADTDLNRPVLEDYAVKHTAPTVSGNAVTVNCVNGNSFAIDMDPATAAVTLTLSNPPASGRYGEVNLHITMGTPAYDITWPGTVTWQGGGAPTLTSTNNEVDLVHLFTIDGGTNWYGTYATAAGGAGALAGLSDTTITSPTDGALLLYDTGTATWRDATMSGDATITDAGAVTLANDYLRADAADIKTTGHLTFNDNVKAEFGTGGDADLYFDGSDFNMIMAATVDFRLKGGSSVPEVMITALADGAVSLAYNGSPKLATTNTGASVTGNLDVSSGVDVTGALKVLQSTQSFNFTLDASNAKILSTGASPKNILIDGPSVALQDGGTTQLITQTHTTADKLTGVQIRHTNGTLYDAGLSHMTRGTNSPSDDADVTGTGTYTVTEDDWHRTLRVNTTSTKTINFPSLSDVKNGAVLWIMNINTGVLTISASTTLQWMDGSGTSKTGNRTLARWGWITVWKLSDTVYYVTGSGLS